MSCTGCVSTYVLHAHTPDQSNCNCFNSVRRTLFFHEHYFQKVPTTICKKGISSVIPYYAEFPESGFSRLDSESETLRLIKSIPRPRPSLVQPCKTRPSPRLRQVLDRETRYFESESLIP